MLMLKIASFNHNQKPSYGIVVDNGIIDCGARLKGFPDGLPVPTRV